MIKLLIKRKKLIAPQLLLAVVKMWSKSRRMQVALIVLSLIAINNADLPCRVRESPTNSILCECDATYCDTITRVAPPPGTFQVYTTSNAGQRFEKSTGIIEGISTDGEEDNFWERAVIRLIPTRLYQEVRGFGGSVTDAASINWRKLSDHAQANLIRSYYGREGLEYNIIRVPIAGSDFSTHAYTYNELPWGDHDLTNYTLSIEDYLYKLPMIKSATRAATSEVNIVASTWSPPVWMKTNDRITGFGLLRPEFYQAYANYHLRFLEEYAKAEVKIWAITTTNEPINGIVPVVTFNSLGWTPQTHARWIANNLGPTIKNSAFPDTLILAIDDQRYLLRIWMLGMEAENPTALDYIDGIAVHYYGNFAPTSILEDINRRYPDKFVIATEACEGAMPWQPNVDLGSWARARRYTQNIMEDMNNHVAAWIDWNLCLSPTGGPNWANNFVDAPILVYGDEDRFVKQPMFYAMGHFSKFIPRGSRRIHVMGQSIFTVDYLAVVTPEGNYVIVLHNRRQRAFQVRIRLDEERQVIINMEPQSIKTVEINARAA